MPRDPDIGTDQECFVCDGSGVIAAHEAKAEPFGYFRAEPMGWTDCAATDEGASALYERPAAPAAPDVDSLAQCIRQIDGSHTMGTAALAERICEWLNDRKATEQAAPAVPRGFATLNEWFLSLPEQRQAQLRDDKWMLAGAAFEAGQALAPAVPQGWKLVPVEPTPDMEGAGRVNMAYGSCTARQVWSAMLAATPAAPSQEPVSERFVWMNNRWWKLHPKATVDADQINGLSVDPGETLMTLVEGQSGDSLKINTKGGQTVVAMVGQHHIEVSAPHKVSDGLFAALINTLTDQCGKPPTVFRSAQEPVTLTDEDILKAIAPETWRHIEGAWKEKALRDGRAVIAAMREKQAKATP